MLQVGACPVEHRHEIIADGLDAAASQVAQASDIVGNELVAVGAAILDALAHGQAFHHAPSESVILDILFHFHHLLLAPHHAGLDVVERCDDAFYANLAQHVQGDFVVGAEPTPCLFHTII